MISCNLRAVKYYIKDLISKNPELATFIYSNREKLSLRVHRNRLALLELANFQFNQSLFDESMNTYLKYIGKYHKEFEQDISVSISPIMSVKDYCLNTKQMYHNLVEEKIRYINKPVIWTHRNDPEVKIPIVQPEIYFAAISDALVIGGNNIIRTTDNIILYDIATEKNADKYELRDENLIFHNNNEVLLQLGKNIEYLDFEAIMFCGKGSKNFAHWFLEFLPQFWVLDQFPEYGSLPLLVDEGCLMDSHNREALNILNKTNRKVVTLKTGKTYRVKKLMVSSRLCITPYNLKTNVQMDTSMDKVSEILVNYMREKFYCKDLNRKPRNVYIPRKKSRFRRLLNEGEVQNIFAKFGFKSVEPHLITFQEKLHLFANVKVVGGPGSSGFLNLLFSPSDSKALFIVSREWKDSTILTQITDSIGQKLYYLLGDSKIGRGDFKFQWDYTFDTSNLKEILEEIVST